MRKTKQLYGDNARFSLMEGVHQVFSAVAPTMGAKGRNVVYKKYGMPIITNDGVSIAREIYPEDAFEAMGADLIKQAAEKTNFEAGDGTSSTIVFGDALISLGDAVLKTGYNPMVLRKEMEDAQVKLLDALKERSIPVTNLEEVARISVENSEIAKLVSDVVTEVGPDGSIIVEEAPGEKVRSETVKGYTWNSGYVSPYMVTNIKGEAELINCAVVVTDRYMSLNSEFFAALSAIKSAGYNSLLIVADNVEGELLGTLLANKEKGNMTTVVVKRPKTIEELEDIATVTGAVAITAQKPIKEITIDHVGFAEKVIVNYERAIVVGKDIYKDAIDERIVEIRNAIENEDGEKYGTIETLKRRLSKLTGGIAKIKVSAKTEAEQAYLKMKIDDAVGACRSALEEGIVPGGGTTLRDLSSVLTDSIKGELIIKAALVKPYLQILHNAGIELGENERMHNFDVLTGEIVKDMIQAGIVDPTKVVRCVIENSISTAKTLLTTECAIVDIPEEPVRVVRG